MTILLAEPLIESCGFNPSLFARKMAEKADTDNPVRFYDAGTAEVIAAIRRGRHWLHAARMVYGGAGNYGNGAAARVAPIPLFYRSRRLVESMAEAQAAITHAHPLGVEAARLQALAIRYALEGVEPRQPPERFAAETSYEEFRSRLQLVPSLLDKSPVMVAELLGNDAPAYEALAAAVYAYARAEGDPAKTLLYAISLGGDTDTIAAMALPLAAAYTSELKGVPARLRENIENIEYVKRLGRQLHEKSIECYSMYG
ncbi:ADP-ribosylglycohydrolase [Hyperthermus butylicus DSM 5456]|uniref:ADP-ribosylglycohydrolase n=1 Tax=Hyperthermus butylicus (strain DSM 5456 / JCM 9403 / PLM1-5) TaxID=415426 RepID=A2BKM6_HYPBU|nr:ADP-ribosylglycohydrolase [Hyperthermus butylicus DSM 5456]